MTSELQQAAQTVEDCIKRYGDEVDWVEWQRIRQRLTPDRERVIEAVRGTGYVTHRQAQEVADAAIDAARGRG